MLLEEIFQMESLQNTRMSKKLLRERLKPTMQRYYLSLMPNPQKYINSRCLQVLWLLTELIHMVKRLWFISFPQDMVEMQF